MPTPTSATEPVMNLPELGDVPSVVASILEQIPDMMKVTQVKRRDGTHASFTPGKIGAAIQSALADVGQKDPELLARCTHQVLMRIDREFSLNTGGHAIPTTEEIARIVATVLIDNNLPFAVKKYFESIAVPHPAPERVSKGLRFARVFTKAGQHPYDHVEWETRDAVITNEKGKAVFEQRGVEVPKAYSQTATNIVVSKYFRGEIGTPGRETSVRQMVDRVALTIANWGRQGGYFSSPADADTFEAELTHILVNQMAAFNSPVWFNVGVNPKPQCSACFINSVKDDMRSIMNLAVTEAMLFKYGSGTGTNLSTLRSSKEKLAHSSGKSSGPVSFMKGFDAFAGVIKSGGKTRRAAKMVILNVDHPDIVEFAECKAKEEHKAHLLIRAGYDSGLDGDAYSSVFFQNANNSVRVTDDFMRLVVENGVHETKAVTTGEPVEKIPARELMGKISQAAWECGDPGVQYDTTINRWNTSANSGRINGSNPCSEFMFLDDTACNLASLNLMKFRRPDGEFDAEKFQRASEFVITAMEIVVGSSSYPTPAIEENSLAFRPLGIGYANLGALLMSRGLAYDSDEGRNFAGAVTALLSGRSYAQSAKVADALEPFAYYKLNEKSFLKVIGMHRDHAYAVKPAGVPSDLMAAAKQSWDDALELGMAHGFRNSQISVLAPTGTIGFLMDCDTTGVEPDIALVKYKWLVGGGLMKIVNGTVPEALTALGYTDAERDDILKFIDKNETIEGAPHLKEKDLPVFDCAFKPAKGERSIHYMGHIRMMAAVQPFISGAISKTVNLPNSATVEDVQDAYMEGWRLGLKAIAIYRDGSKGQQVLTTTAEKNSDKGVSENRATESRGQSAAGAPVPTPTPVVERVIEKVIEYRPLRRRLSDERKSITHKFSVGGHEGYITIGLYDDGQPGEMFIRMAKGGSVVSGLMDSFATSTSIALQYGVPLKVLVNKFVHVRFEPSGFTTHPNIRIAKSMVDYIFRWMAIKFLSPEDAIAAGANMDQPTVGDAVQSDVSASAGIKEPDTEAAEETVAAMAGISSGIHPQAPPDGSQLKLEDAPERSRTANALTMSFDVHGDSPACDTCGAIMVRNAACYKCLNCGSTSGCS